MKSNDPSWLSPVIKYLINQRWVAYRTKNFSRYNFLKCKIKESIRKAKLKWANKSANSSKSLWNTVHNTLGTSASNPH
jgi:hypothetical protein